MISEILDYAHSVGGKTISVGYRMPWCDFSFDALSPFQWLGYFAACDCVITTMFHGMIYSVLNHRDFCMLETPYRKNKVGNLLDELGLSGRMINENESVKDVFSARIDFLKVDELLEKKCVRSKEFLLRALKS
jgi:exopolysaccharide biosynthesis predicted pyruvyltransferase EpsI